MQWLIVIVHFSYANDIIWVPFPSTNIVNSFKLILLYAIGVSFEYRFVTRWIDEFDLNGLFYFLFSTLFSMWITAWIHWKSHFGRCVYIHNKIVVSANAYLNQQIFASKKKILFCKNMWPNQPIIHVWQSSEQKKKKSK